MDDIVLVVGVCCVLVHNEVRSFRFFDDVVRLLRENEFVMHLLKYYACDAFHGLLGKGTLKVLVRKEFPLVVFIFDIINAVNSLLFDCFFQSRDTTKEWCPFVKPAFFHDRVD